MPVRPLLRALLIAVAAPGRSFAATRASAMINCASAYFATGIAVVTAGYLSAVQMRVDAAVPARPESVARTRGSGAPSSVTLRNVGSTDDHEFSTVCT